MIIEFTLYGTPITKKNSQQILTNRATGKPFITQSNQYKQYEQDCVLQIPRQAKQKIDQPCKVTTIFYMPDKRRVDVSNLVSAAHDILVAGNVLKDDSSAIVKIIVAWATVDKENPRTEILIETTEWEERDMKQFTITEIANKLIGCIDACGESNHDEASLKNLDDVDYLLYYYVSKLLENAIRENDHQGTVHLIAEKSRKIIDELKELLQEEW